MISNTKKFPSYSRSNTVVFPFVMASLVAMTASQPIHIQACSVSAPMTLETGDAGYETYGGYNVRIRFVNTARQPVSRVTFRLNDGTAVVDRGTFSPNVPIDHTFFNVPPTEADSCGVSGARFSDGSSWDERVFTDPQ
jgi:hypothetical protein